MTEATALRTIATNCDELDLLRQEFLSLYPHRAKYICKLKNQDKWRTWTGPLDDHQILAVIADGGRGGLLRGAHWSALTRFAVLDIDRDSRYHNKDVLGTLAKALAMVGLESKLYRSSESGGWHLYLPFDEWANSKEVEETLKRWLKVNGYQVKSGQLEIFPSGNALRLPLQPGFAWLDSTGEIERERNSMNLQDALTFFLSDLELNARSWSDAKKLIESQIREADRAAGRDAQEHQDAIDVEDFEDLFRYRTIEENCETARKYLASGLTESGTRHKAIYSIQHLLWHGDDELKVPKLPGPRNAEKRFQFLRKWIEENHNGKCRHINVGNWDRVESHIRRVCAWKAIDVFRESRYEPYKLTQRAQDRLFDLARGKNTVLNMRDFRVANEKRQAEAREKIKRAVSYCLSEHIAITRRKLQALTGCSPNTVRKHADLWRGLSCGSGVMISGDSLEVVPCASEIAAESFESSEEENGNRFDSESESESVLATVESARALVCINEFDSLRLDDSGATASNSTEVVKEKSLPPLLLSLTTGSNSGQGSSLGRAVRSLNGSLPTCVGPLHLPQTLGHFVVAHPRALVTSRQGLGYAQVLLYGSSGQESNRMWWQVRGPPGQALA